MTGRTLVTGLLCALATFSSAQTTGKLRLFVDPGANFQFVVDQKYRLQQREIELPEGPHRFTFWAPERSMVDTTLSVTGGTTKDVLLRLPFSPEYNAYLQQYRAYRNARQVRRLVPLATAGAGIWAGLEWLAVKNAGDALDNDEADYRQSVVPSEITRIKEQTIPDHNGDLRTARTLAWLATGLTVMGAYASVRVLKHTPRTAAPVFEDKERLRFEKLVWLPSSRSSFGDLGLIFTIR